MPLSDRKKKILRAVIEEYIQTAEPVGSKSLLASGELQVSSATIRNEMAELEALGLLEQPHTSAGRIPSAQGYRIYVNELMEEHRLSMQETESMNEALQLKIREMDQVITEAGRVISRLTSYPSFALTAASAKASIARYDLLPVDERSFILLVMTSTQLVRNKLVSLPEALPEAQIQLLSALLNSSFVGKTLEELQDELEKTRRHTGGEAGDLIALAVEFASATLQEQEGKLLHTAGIPNLLAQPEFRSADRAGPLMSYLSDWAELPELPERARGAGVDILIGPENVASELQNSSIIMARYDIGDNMQGVIGVVGPTRMDYAKLAARLSYFAEGLSRMFGKPELKTADDQSE